VVLSSPINLSDEDKLEALRRLDQFRPWRSLDEKRYCLVCGKIITGKQIQVTGGTRGNGPLRLSCPTERCHSIPMDWVLPTDEILANADMTTAEDAPASSFADRGDSRHGIASRLRKLALRFRR
jgi:hypothetical protein